MPPSFPLPTEPWIQVWDLDAQGPRDVGILEALTRAHRLSIGSTQAEGIAVLRLLIAVFDAACGPTSEAEWDAAWKAATLDVDAVTTYLDRWAGNLDLFHPAHPAFQCGQLTGYPRGPEALHPGSLAGDGGAFFHHELSQPLQAWPPARAAVLLLHLLTYDVAGIKRAAPGDPAGRGSKVYGSRIGPVAEACHLHLRTGPDRLKDLLLLNLPPQPRAADDSPVWERDTPPAPMRTRTPTGRLDLLTWPHRRIRLHATADNTVDQVAHHDGDRLEDSWATIQQLDPMTAWETARHGDKNKPLRFIDQHWAQPWRAASLLDSSSGPAGTASVIQHTIAAAERGVLDPDMPLGAVLSTVIHSNRHRSTISDIPVTLMPLGTAKQLADPQSRRHLARMSRYADALNGNLRTQAMKISQRPTEQVGPRMTLNNVDQDWQDAVLTSATDPEQATAQWGDALRTAAERNIAAFPLRPDQRAQLLAAYTQTLKPPAMQERPRKASEPVAADDAPRRRGRAAPTYAVFGGQYTLSQLSQHPDCVVSYKTLRQRVTDGWDIEDAATTRGTRGSRS
ncbi:type I-E CRISPR-associated protein Cse1/CasA [Streptomyces chartreusis]